ncbi:MAG: hypothetical protein JWP78_3097 [Mucilaginibacter sp.]|nr:hypothetical protein [Mucilaginibacter sp.]
MLNLFVSLISRTMKSYFKHRRRFDLSTDTFDIGRPLHWKKGYEGNHFLFRLLQREESDYPDFYRYHLDYFLQSYPGCREQEFFIHVWKIVSAHIVRLQLKNNYASTYPRDMMHLEKLEAFRNYLGVIDQWDTGKDKDAIIARKETEIQHLRDQLKIAERALADAKRMDTKDFIDIRPGYILSVVDLLLQLQELKLPSLGKELVLSQTQTVWTKLIAKYFREGKNEIKEETIRRYFPADKKNPGVKYAPVPEKMKLFKIRPSPGQ